MGACLHIANAQILSCVSTCQITHYILIVIFDNPHYDIWCWDPISSFCFHKFSNSFHLYRRVFLKDIVWKTTLTKQSQSKEPYTSSMLSHLLRVVKNQSSHYNCTKLLDSCDIEKWDNCCSEHYCGTNIKMKRKYMCIYVYRDNYKKLPCALMSFSSRVL